MSENGQDTKDAAPRFARAERKQARLILAIWGPSGSGKTYGALKIAAGLGGKIAVIDSERGSASLYADLAAFDVLELSPPFSPSRYVEAIGAAAAAGYSVVVIDSLSHAWSGAGGVLEMVDAAQAKARNQFTAWRDVTPEHNGLVDALLQSPIHVIATLRTKTAYEVVDDGRGKKAPVKIGLAPIQRDGLEYEFTACLELAIEKHIAWATKDRTRIFGDQPFVISEESGKRLAAWLAGAKPAPTAPPPPSADQEPGSGARRNAAVAALRRVRDDMAARGVSADDIAREINDRAGVEIIVSGRVMADRLTDEALARVEAAARLPKPAQIAAPPKPEGMVFGARAKAKAAEAAQEKAAEPKPEPQA